MRFTPSAGANNTRNEKALPELVNAIALVVHKLTKPAPFIRVATEKSVLTRTDKAPSASKFERSQPFVIQNEDTPSVPLVSGNLRGKKGNFFGSDMYQSSNANYPRISPPPRTP